MKRWIFLITLLTTYAYASNKNVQMLDQIKRLEHFAFGSCNSQKRSQPLWEYINRDNPQLWIWGGDNIYADTSDPNIIQQLYQYQNNVPGYKQLKKTTPIIGIWDDHDYGYDNATWNNPMKHISQQLFLDFIAEPSKSTRRIKEGVYTSHTFGQIGQRVKFIFLDNRFNHSSPEKDADLLGSDQWVWLENELKYSKAQVHFIMAGLSILSAKIPKTEEWNDHPKAKERLLNLINKYNPRGLVFLSGDKHFASVFQRDGHLEFMSSGMTHTVPKYLRRYVSRFYPNTFYGLNYGQVKINWETTPVEIELNVKTYREEPVWSFKYRLNKKNKWEKIK